jgi:hypothetical protein
MEFKYFAFVNKDNVVENVIVCNSIENFRELTINSPMGMSPGRWIPVTDETRSASKGNNYDPVKNMFYPEQRFASWTLNKETMYWEPPVPKPDPVFDENGKMIKAWVWDESTLQWLEDSMCPNCQ